MTKENVINQRIEKPKQVAAYFEKLLLEEKLNNWLGVVIFLFVAFSFGYLIAQKTLLGLSLVSLIVGFALVITCLASTEIGLYINMIYSFFAFHISRQFFNDTLPVGVLSDILIVTIFFSLFINRVNVSAALNNFSKNAIVIALLVLYSYMAIELFNPSARSFNGWFMGFRKSAMTLFLLFTTYQIFNSYQKIKTFIKVLFILCLITGIYGCIQQWHGLFDFEYQWVTSDPNRFGLYFIQGNFRKFSTMSDPTAFSMVMGACSIFFTILLFNQKKIHYIITLVIGICIMLMAMTFSGTRTANAMVVAGFAFFILLTFDRKSTRVFALVGTLLFLTVLYGPFNNPTINRVRTTFAAKNDDSFNVREVARKYIQPYIHSHPIGGGLGTTGATGQALHPGHFLAGFQPDSGYLKKALEMGWMGLAIFCIIYFLVLKTGVQGYFRSIKLESKVIYAGCTAAIFSLYTADFSQIAIGQITDIFVYYPFIAILLKLRTLEFSEN